MNELKMCPFCGSKAELVTILGRPAISCYNCPAIMIRNYDTDKQELILAWNNRDASEMLKHYWQGMADAEAKRKGELMQAFDPD